MKILVVAVILLLSQNVAAERIPEKNEAVLKLAKNMGIDVILESTLAQTKDALTKTMLGIAIKAKSKLPDMSEEQETELNSIFIKYVENVIGAVDVKEATYIYTNIIASEMTIKQVNATNSYFESDEGKDFMQVVGLASTKLNEYILNAIGESQNSSSVELRESLVGFKEKLTLQQDEQQ